MNAIVDNLSYSLLSDHQTQKLLQTLRNMSSATPHYNQEVPTHISDLQRQSLSA
jgi:hypothetical protein